MKKGFALLLCIVMLFASTTTSFADVSHYEDGHFTKTFEDLGIKVEIPKGWESVTSESGMVGIFPLDNREIILMLYAVDLGEDNISDAIANVYLIKAADNSMEGLTGESDNATSTLFQMMNGQDSAGSVYRDSNYVYVVIDTFCGSKLVVLSLKIPPSDYNDVFLDDMESILISAKEI